MLKRDWCNVKVGENHTLLNHTPYTPAEVAAPAIVIIAPAVPVANHFLRLISYRRHDYYPRSMKVTGGVRAGYAEGLVGRAADVVERGSQAGASVLRKCRSARFISGKHACAFSYGVAIVPPMPGKFYNLPQNR